MYNGHIRGFTFELADAMYSSISVGDPIAARALLFIGFILIAGSSIFQHKK